MFGGYQQGKNHAMISFTDDFVFGWLEGSFGGYGGSYPASFGSYGGTYPGGFGMYGGTYPASVGGVYGGSGFDGQMFKGFGAGFGGGVSSPYRYGFQWDRNVLITKLVNVVSFFKEFFTNFIK